MADYSQVSQGSQVISGGGQEMKSKEARLLDILQRIRGNSGSYFAIHLHLSQLRSSHRQPHFLRMAKRSIDALTAKQDVQAFYMLNDDAVLLCRNVPVDDVDDTVFRVRAIFHEDPLTQSEDGSAEDNFSTWFDLTQQGDFKALEDTTVDLAKQAEAAKGAVTESLSTGRAAKTMMGDPLEPELLGTINQKLLEVRIGDLVRRQPAILVSTGEAQVIAFREHYVAMEELRKRIAPKVNIFASNWLFQYLSETLDARVLEAMSRMDFSMQDCKTSLNLNMSSVLSRSFQTFNAIVGEYSDQVIIEIQIIDIFSDMHTFNRTRDWLHDHGYKVLVDGLNPLSLHFFDPSVLGADFIKMSWGPEVRGGVSQDHTDQIKKVVENMPENGVVLARVDSEEGVSWGLSLGIRCFQGHFTDRVVEAMAEKGLI